MLKIVNRLKKNEKGFSYPVVVLVIIVLALIGVVGYLVYENNSPDKDTTNTVANQQAQKTNESASATDKQANYFEIKELGVKFEQPTSLQGLYYVIGNNGRSAYFSMEELANTKCAADNTSQLALTRYTDADFEESTQEKPLKDYAKKIGDYYFFTIKSQSLCDYPESSSQIKASDMVTEMIKILPDSLVSIE